MIEMKTDCILLPYKTVKMVKISDERVQHKLITTAMQETYDECHII